MAARCLLGSILSGLRLFPVVWPATRMGTTSIGHSKPAGQEEPMPGLFGHRPIGYLSWLPTESLTRFSVPLRLRPQTLVTTFYKYPELTPASAGRKQPTLIHLIFALNAPGSPAFHKQEVWGQTPRASPIPGVVVPS